MVVGESEKFASAIISPNIPFIKEWCTKNNLEFTSKEEIINKPEIYALIQEDIKLFNKSFSKSERLLRFKLVADEWSPNTGELSPTLKLRRRYISEKYKPLIDQIYGKQSDN